MKKFALTILYTLLTSPAWATTYYLAPASGGGNDSNNGMSASTPWLTPNHEVNCGDVILAAASTAYDSNNFAHNWGTVTCPGGNNVAWLKCATFDTCKITDTGGAPIDNGMIIQTSFWGVQGWEITTTASSGTCFIIYPYNNSNIHHVIFANDICNGAGQGGFSIAPRASYAEDYIAFIGDIAYNATQGSNVCTSGFNDGSQVSSDTLPGTHIYFAGNFAWNNVDGNPCNGGTPTDGEGLMFDTLVGYAQQIVADNNISVFNGGRGIMAYSSSNAPIHFRHNTVYGNNTDTNQPDHGICGEIVFYSALRSQAYLNLALTNSPLGCGGDTKYAYAVIQGNSTNLVYQNDGYDASGNNDGSYLSTGFSYGPNNRFGTNPSFPNPVDPPAPSCRSASSVPNCMATVIADFTPTNPSAIGYGYHAPIPMQTYDPLFPQWLCNVNLPAGLVTLGCLSASSLPAPPTITGVAVQ